ncbi:MAG: hypothetical protein Q8P18_07120 [Pseudomonadota bacterium]|nr:hypothetical protein [Pseudomonadota bacterium]
MLILALLACLPVAPAPARETVGTSITSTVPLHTQASLAEAGAPTVRGRVVGTCAGPVRIEASSASQANTLAAEAVATGPFALRVPSGTALLLRWGCDADADGEVAGADVSEAKIGLPAGDLALVLQLPDPARTARFALATPRGTVVPRPRAPPGGGEALAPPLADGPAPKAGTPPAPGEPPPAPGSPPTPGGPPIPGGPPLPAGSAPPR